MTTSQDERFRKAYSRFGRDHATLREDLLAKIQAAPVGAAARWRERFGPIIMHWAAGLAAAMAVVVGFLLLRTATPAYAFEDLPLRFAECRSILVEGWSEHSAGVRLPIRIYVEQPNVYWYSTHAVTPDRVATGYVASDGRRYLCVDESEHTAVTGEEIPLAAELEVQLLLQTTLSSEQLGLKGDGYQKTGLETIRGLPADVYQLRGRDRRRVVWVDRAIGVPIQIAVYEIDKGVERQCLSFEIRPNVVRPATFPSLEPPASYATTHLDRAPATLFSVGSGCAARESFEIRLALRIDDRAVLVCWRRFSNKHGTIHEPDLGGAVGRPDTLRVKSLDEKRSFKVYRLKDDRWGDGLHARWSLVVPEDDQTDLGLASAILETEGNRTSIDIVPLTFKADRLAQVVDGAQRLSLPKGASQDGVLTLRQLQKLARTLRDTR